ncbi:hypothetical protein Bca101_057783 [Brassica carinata]
MEEERDELDEEIVRRRTRVGERELRHMDLNGGAFLGNSSIPRVRQQVLERVNLVEEQILGFFAMKIPRKPQHD